MSMNPKEMRKLMAQAQKMQEQMASAQSDLSAREFEGSSGGGMVKVTVRGSGEILRVNIDPAVIDPGDPEMLGDLVVAAIKSAMTAMTQVAEQQTSDITSGMDLGGLLG
jgi:DNA-binding YbaB/EbfC family protein